LSYTRTFNDLLHLRPIVLLVSCSPRMSADAMAVRANQIALGNLGFAKRKGHPITGVPPSFRTVERTR